MDGRRFPNEPWSGESENPRANPVGGLWLCRAHFSLVTFLLCEQKKVTRLTLRQAEALDLQEERKKESKKPAIPGQTKPHCLPKKIITQTIGSHPIYREPLKT